MLNKKYIILLITIKRRKMIITVVIDDDNCIVDVYEGTYTQTIDHICNEYDLEKDQLENSGWHIEELKSKKIE